MEALRERVQARITAVEGQRYAVTGTGYNRTGYDGDKIAHQYPAVARRLADVPGPAGREALQLALDLELQPPKLDKDYHVMVDGYRCMVEDLTVRGHLIVSTGGERRGCQVAFS